MQNKETINLPGYMSMNSRARCHHISPIEPQQWYPWSRCHSCSCRLPPIEGRMDDATSEPVDDGHRAARELRSLAVNPSRNDRREFDYSEIIGLPSDFTGLFFSN